MQRALATSIVIAMWLLAGSPEAVGAPGDDFANGWHLDYRSARKLAERANKPLMVVFRCVP